jgi:Ca-activated chloride channel homolog
MGRNIEALVHKLGIANNQNSYRRDFSQDHSRALPHTILLGIKTSLLILIFLTLTGFHWRDPLAKWIGLGNQELEKGDVEKAAKSYQEAQKVAPDSPVVQNNMGILDYKTDKMDEAKENFERAANSKDSPVKSQAFYNKGVTEIKGGKYQDAVESFENALLANPSDPDAKVNLEMAKKMLQMQTQTPQAQQTQQNDQNQTQPPSQETPTPNPETPSPQQTGSQEEKKQEESQETQTQSENQTQTPSSASQQSQEATPTPQASQTAGAQASSGDQTQTPEPEETPVEGQMSAQEAARLLDAMEDQEMEVLKRFHQLPESEERHVEKDW